MVLFFKNNQKKNFIYYLIKSDQDKKMNLKYSGDSEQQKSLFKYGEVKQKQANKVDKKKCCYPNDDMQKCSENTYYSFDTFFIFISFIISYWLKVKGFTLSTWVLPIPICFILTKAKLLCLSDSIVFCMLLKIARFIIYHYKLILIITILSIILPLLRSKTILLFLILFILLYLFAKYANKQNENHHIQMTRIIDDESITSSENS